MEGACEGQPRALVVPRVAAASLHALMDRVHTALVRRPVASPLVWPFLVLLPRRVFPSSARALERLGQLPRRAATGNDGPRGDNGNGGKDKKDSGGTVPPMDDDDNPEQWLIARTVLFVLTMILLTVVLYRLSLPNGAHVGWTSLRHHAGHIRQVALYPHYAQVYLDSGKAYLGLVDDPNTQRHVEELAGSYAVAVAEAKAKEREAAKELPAGQAGKEGARDSRGKRASAAPSKAEGPREEEAAVAATPMAGGGQGYLERPDELPLVIKGTPMAESALAAVGVFAWVVPFVFFPVFTMFLSQYIGKSMSYAVDATRGSSKVADMLFKVDLASSTRFRDIAGMKEPKKEITEIVDFLRHPERYTKLGAKIPTGALLLGPPGTGKTLLAKAVAGESNVGFIPVCGSDFMELYVGMGALRVRQLFKEARKQRCIVYIDEIDAIGLKRQGAGHGEKQEQEQTLNELLTQLDGFNTGKRGEVMVLASSNVAQEALDPALIRPGRFDRIIHVDTPVISERVDIFKVHLSKLKLTPTPEESAGEGSQDGPRGEEGNTGGDSASAGEKTTDGATPTSASGDASSATEDRSLRRKDSAPATDAAPAANTTETRLALSTLEEEKKDDEAILAQEKDGRLSFDIRSLLLGKSDQERALIDTYAHRMSNLCPGFVGADIANVCNEGAILAAREGAGHVDIRHLERSIDRVLAGIEHRSRVLSPFEKTVVAHHEAGHAVAGWFLNRADPLMKVSIVPRGGSALGYAQYLPNENASRTASEIRDSISVTLGGRAAEEIFFGHLSTGASDDLRKVGRMAYLYVSAFAPGSVYPAPGSSATRLVKPFGVRKANDFDQRAKAFVDEVYRETKALLWKHKEDMERLAQHLLKHEVLTYQEVVNYLGARGDRVRDRRKGV